MQCGPFQFVLARNKVMWWREIFMCQIKCKINRLVVQLISKEFTEMNVLRWLNAVIKQTSKCRASSQPSVEGGW